MRQQIRVSSPSTDGLVMSRELKTFTLTAQHITLLRAFGVGWQNCETGAPEIDPKRPYGNSSVAHDVADLLGVPLDIRDGEYEDMSEEMHERMLAIHRQTDVALQIVLATGSFEPGQYTCPQYSNKWIKSGDATPPAEADPRDNGDEDDATSCAPPGDGWRRPRCPQCGKAFGHQVGQCNSDHRATAPRGDAQ